MTSNDPTIYQLYVELVDSYPPIWRCFQVPASFTLAQLHQVLQAVVGWQDGHAHLFKVNNQRYGQPAAGLDIQDEQEICLSSIFSPDPQPFFYTYSLKEGWLHRLELDKPLPLPPEAAIAFPTCVDGERSCPPAQSGGVWGYEEFLERLNDPEDPDYVELWEQAGPDFDPERFNLKAANQRLAQLKF